MTTEILKATHGPHESGTTRPEDTEKRTTNLVSSDASEPEPPFHRPATEGALHIYEVDDGATYWVAASDIWGAVAAVAALTAKEGEAEENGLTVERVDWAKAERIEIRDDGSGETRSAAELAAQTTSPAVIACSEW